MGRALKMTVYAMAAVLLLVVVAIGLWVFVVQNVEQPAYALRQRDGAIELRDYPTLIVAEVVTRGDRRLAVNAGFRPLANYIFAKERAGAAIPMTAPVTQQRTPIAMTAPVMQQRSVGSGDDTWVVHFIMPAKYTLADLPQPAPGTTVELKALPATRRAAIRFSGVATDASVAEQEAALRRWMAANGQTPSGPPVYAYYNDPFTPGPLRRNEVLFDVAVKP